MTWFRDRPTPDVAPLETPHDVGSGTHARIRAEQELSRTLRESDQDGLLKRALRDIVQKNHIQEILRESIYGRG